MNIFKKIFRNKNAHTTPLFISDIRSSLDSYMQLDATSFSCVDKIATAFSNLSVGIYDRKTKQKITSHNLYSVLNEPNLDETKSLFWYCCVKDYFSGNVYLYKYYDENGNLISLFRLNPESVIVTRDEYNRKVYTYLGKRFYSDKILHIPSRFGYNGKVGSGIYAEARKLFQTANSLDEYTENTFNSNMGKRLIIDITDSYPNATEEEKLAIREKFLQNYSGISNAGKPLVKSGKTTFSTIDTGVSDNRSTELTLNREFQQKIIALIFNIPLEYLTGTGTADIETISTLFMTQAILPIATAFEENLEKLLSPADREKYYIEYNYNSILKTSLNNKISCYNAELTNGILSVNEIRAKENLPPLDESTAGTTHFVQSNLMPLTDSVINSYMASAKLKAQELTNPNTQTEHADTANGNIGDDKK